jgi:hemolysin activation/secretion protein
MSISKTYFRRLFAASALTACFVAAPAQAQNFDRVAPQQPAKPAPSTPPAPPAQAATPRGDAVIVPQLKGLSFVTKRDANAHPAAGIDFDGIAMLQQPGLKEELEPYLGKPLTFDQIGKITDAVVGFYRAHNRPLVNVVVPEQDVQSGVLQVVVVEYKVGEVKVEGNQYFSSEAISAPITYKSGDTVDSEEIANELDVVNANPFRHVDLIYKPGAQPDTTDLVLQTQDRFPLRVYAGYDNNGEPVVGRDRWNVGFNWGNAFNLDEMLSYQFTTSSDFFTGRSAPAGEPSGTSYMAHSLSWSAPLPWNDRLSIFGDYEQTVPHLGNNFGLTGKSGQASLRYSIALPRTREFTQGIEIGYDFKTTNNNLDFGGTMISRNAVEIDQFPIGYSANLVDPSGSTGLTATLFWSPGGLTDNNTDAALQPAPGQSGRQGAKADYIYVRGEIDRLTRLPSDMTWAVRLLGQTSNRNLLDTEQLSVGGADLLRGYDPNTINGDEGVVLSNELRSPMFHVLPDGPYQDQAQVLAFWDYASVRAHQEFAGDLKGEDASSAGVGLRYDVATYLTVKFDYGWQLRRLPGEASKGQYGFVSVSLGY